MPQPAENNATRAGTSLGRRAKSPAGANAGSSSPGYRLSSSQLDTRPPATRLTVIDSVSGRDGLDEIIRDLILLEKCEFIDTFLEINEGEFSIGISEENADEILDMEDIVPLKENKEIKQVMQKLDLTLMSLNYRPEVTKKHMRGDQNFLRLKEEVDALGTYFANLTDEVNQITSVYLMAKKDSNLLAQRLL